MANGVFLTDLSEIDEPSYMDLCLRWCGRCTSEFIFSLGTTEFLYKFMHRQLGLQTYHLLGVLIVPLL
jgi:hypothetical protein